MIIAKIAMTFTTIFCLICILYMLLCLYSLWSYLCIGQIIFLAVSIIGLIILNVILIRYVVRLWRE
jgi:hypothetical protein